MKTFKERATNAIMGLLLIFLSAVVMYAIVMMVKDYNKTPHHDEDEDMLTVLYVADNHRIFYDTETGVMYVEYSSHGGITPMYNPDGSLRIYEEE